MKNIRILIDTNVLIDYLANRTPYAEDAYSIIELCIFNIVDACIAAHTVTNLFFILRKELSDKKRREILLNFCRVFTVVDIDLMKLESALKNDEFVDFEDCLQYECANDFKAEYIVTRNIQDFKKSLIKAIEPREFLMNLKI